MKRFLLSIAIITSFKCMAQKQKLFMFDKTDPFTKERRINYGNAHLNEFAQVGVGMTIKDEAKIHTLIFIIPYIESTTQREDSVIKECKLKLVNDTIVMGKWKGTNTSDILGKKYTSFSYEFTEDDFKKLQSIAISAVKMNEYTYDLPAKNQKKISELITTVYSKL